MQSQRIENYENIAEFVESVEGFMMPGQEEFLFEKVTSLSKHAVIVEIGAFKGRSTIAMGYACLGTGRKIYCIDTWDGNDTDFDHRDFFAAWQNNIESNGLSDNVIPLCGNSHEILSSWENYVNLPIDMVFIDGSHQYEDVRMDFELAYSHVREGGLIVFHDVIEGWPGPVKVWENIACQKLINTEYCASIACGIKMSNNSQSRGFNTTNLPLKLDIACGKRTKPGFRGVDIWEGADIICDLEKFPWPFEDNSVDEIHCSHYIEHTPDLISFANELYRILKVGGKAQIIAPYYSSIRAWQDPTHLRAISENTFLYFNKHWREINKLDHYPIVSDFDFECHYIIDQAWRDKEHDELNFAIKHYINVVNDIHAVLTKRKACADDIESLMRQAEELWERGQQQEASGICQDLLDRGEGNLEVSLMLAEHALQNGMMEEGVAHFRQALQYDEESIQAHVGIARALAKGGRKDEAQSHVEGVRQINPDLAELIAEFVSDDLL